VPADRAETVEIPELGVQDESTGLMCDRLCGGGRLSDEEVKEESDEDEAAISIRCVVHQVSAFGATPVISASEIAPTE
jgi:hypothetical protein